MSLIMLYFLHSTPVFSFYIDVVLRLVISKFPHDRHLTVPAFDLCEFKSLSMVCNMQYIAIFANVITSGKSWVGTQQWFQWCPSGKAPGHEYPQSWIKIHCIWTVSYKNITMKVRNDKRYSSKYPFVIELTWLNCTEFPISRYMQLTYIVLYFVCRTMALYISWWIIFHMQNIMFVFNHKIIQMYKK